MFSISANLFFLLMRFPAGLLLINFTSIFIELQRWLVAAAFIKTSKLVNVPYVQQINLLNYEANSTVS